MSHMIESRHNSEWVMSHTCIPRWNAVNIWLDLPLSHDLYVWHACMTCTRSIYSGIMRYTYDLWIVKCHTYEFTRYTWHDLFMCGAFTHMCDLSTCIRLDLYVWHVRMSHRKTLNESCHTDVYRLSYVTLPMTPHENDTQFPWYINNPMIYQ